MHHAAGNWPRVVDFDAVSEAGEVIRGRQSARPAANYQNTFAAARGLNFKLPLFCRGEIAEKALDRMNTDGSVKFGTVAGSFARMVANPAMDCRHWIVAHQGLPRLPVLARLGQRQPRLDVLTRWAGMIARRQQVDIDRVGATRRPSDATAGQVDQRAHVVVAIAHAASVTDGTG
jgi:hypothetical protein